MPEQALSFEFRERMLGPVAKGITDPRAGAARGREAGTVLRLDLQVRVPDLEAFFRDPKHTAQLAGSVSCAGLARAARIETGTLEVYVPAARQQAKLMRYTAAFRADAGEPYLVRGTKVLHTPFPSLREQVTLYTLIHEGVLGGPLWGAGILSFRLRDLPGFLLSMRAPGGNRLKALLRFLLFAQRELAQAAELDLAGDEDGLLGAAGEGRAR